MATWRRNLSRAELEPGVIVSIPLTDAFPRPKHAGKDASAPNEVDFSLADGRTLTRQVGDACFQFQGEGGAAPVIFGEKGDEPSLGATTLGSIGLVLDPFKRQLIPMRTILA